MIDCRGRERKRETTWMKATEKRKSKKEHEAEICTYTCIYTDFKAAPTYIIQQIKNSNSCIALV